MGETERAAVDAFEQGYLAAVGDFRQHVEALLNGLQAASGGLGDFYLLVNGLQMGVLKMVGDFELRSVKMLSLRRQGMGG